MIAWLNGRFIPEADARVSVFDRSFLYGDGLFETILVEESSPVRWDAHLRRFAAGSDFLRIAHPCAAPLQAAARELIRVNQAERAALRMTLSRGVGPRGYSPAGAGEPTLVMALQLLSSKPDLAARGVQVIVSSIRLAAGDPLACFKTANKLHQILARREADDRGVEEALLLDAAGRVITASSANLFWCLDGKLYTPPVSSGLLPGITRLAVIQAARGLGIAVCETLIAVPQLLECDGVFLTSSIAGIRPILSVDGRKLAPCSRLVELEANLPTAV